jgi:hypothetical protein
MNTYIGALRSVSPIQILPMIAVPQEFIGSQKPMVLERRLLFLPPFLTNWVSLSIFFSVLLQ